MVTLINMMMMMRMELEIHEQQDDDDHGVEITMLKGFRTKHRLRPRQKISLLQDYCYVGIRRSLQMEVCPALFLYFIYECFVILLGYGRCISDGLSSVVKIIDW
jgi:hypothetical protein